MNPVNVLIEQLENTKHSQDQQIWEQHKKAITAETRNRRRRRDDVKSMTYLDVQQQVEVLVDLATDPNVLGRQWGAAAMWI